MKKEFTYKLTSPVMVASGGKEIEGIEVLVKSPRPKDKLNAMSLEAVLTRCMMKAASTNKGVASDNSGTTSQKEESENDSAVGFVSLAMMGADKNDIYEMLALLSDLLCEGNKENPQATIEGQKFTRPLFDELQLLDTKAILGRYFADFLHST